MKKITLPQLLKMKGERKISMITCYDASFAKLMEKSEIDSILVGDSLGMVIKGENSTLGVDIDEVTYHVKAVKKGAPSPFLIADMPFGSYQTSESSAVKNAVTLLKAGAEAVKVEGGEETVNVIKRLTSIGIPVCGHVGLTPQYINSFGNYKKRGTKKDEYEKIYESAIAVQDAGASLIVLEMIPEDLAEKITSTLTIPTVGIGAGLNCDGQVLVIYDLLGIDETFNPSFLKKYCNLDKIITDAVTSYISDVKNSAFPDK